MGIYYGKMSICDKNDYDPSNQHNEFSSAIQFQVPILDEKD